MFMMYTVTVTVKGEAVRDSTPPGCQYLLDTQLRAERNTTPAGDV